MFKLLFLVAFVASGALAFEEDLHVSSYPEEDVYVAAEDLPPRTLIRFRRQLFGGISSTPFGGFNSNIGARGTLFSSPTKDFSAFGKVSQSATPGGLGSFNLGPATFNGGADFATSSGHGLSGRLSHTDGLGGSRTLGGNFNLLNTPSNKWDVFGSNTRNFDSNFKPFGPSSTTLGTKWANENGAQASFSRTKTAGFPNSYDYSAATPVFNGNAAVGLTGKTVERMGSEVTLTGKAQITDNVVGSLSHTKLLDTKLHPLASSTTLGADYNHQSGLQVSASGTKTSGQPNSATVGASVPLFTSKDGNTKVNAAAQSTFTDGHKPNHQVGITVGTSF